MKNSLAIAYSMKRKAKNMADGGMADTDSGPKTVGSIINYPGMAEGGAVEMGADMIDRIMSKRANMSEGGKVANSTSVTADEMPAEYDDLVLRDDLESSNSGANAGDEIGNEQESADRSDIVERVMKSRAKKDRLPNPR